MTNEIYLEQKSFGDNISTKEFSSIDTYKQYLILLPPERIALITIREILKAIFNRVIIYNKMKNENKPTFIDSNENVYNLNIRKLIENLATEFSKEIYYEYELKTFKEKVEKSKYSTQYKTQLIKKFSEYLKDELKKNRKDFLNGFNEIIPHSMKMKIAGILVYFSRF